MIDGRRLDYILDVSKLCHVKFDFSGLSVETLRSEEMCELIRLAHMGLWAEKYGIPALRHGDQHNRAAALAALPKEKL